MVGYGSVMTLTDRLEEEVRMPIARKPGRRVRSDIAMHKRERIIDAATELFYERGFHNTTLDDVAERLGMTKPFIYSSFGSKTAILGEICSRGVQRALQEIEAAQATNAPPTETLQLFVPQYVAAILRTQKNIAINIREEKNLDPHDAERLATLRHEFMSRVEALLRAGKEAGEFALDDPRIAAFAMVGAVSWTTFWYNSSGPFSATNIAERMTGVILNMAQITPRSDKN